MPMSSLILDYRMADGPDPQDRCLQLTPFWRNPGEAERAGATHPHLASQTIVSELSKEVCTTLAAAVQGMYANHGELDAAATQGFLEELRRLGTRLRELLLPAPLVAELEASPFVRHLVFRCDPSLNGVPFELMFLGDFLGFRYGTGRELLTVARPALNAQPAAGDAQQPYHGYGLVDPGQLLSNAGAAGLREEFDLFQTAWDDGRHPGDGQRQFHELIGFDDCQAFHLIRKEDLIEAIRHHEVVFLVCHHRFDAQDPGRSGFVLAADNVGNPAEMLTAQDLTNALGPGHAAPRLMLSVACESGIAPGWEHEWTRGDRLFGMVDAAIRSGVRQYISTLISIPADRSPALVLSVCREVVLGQTVGEALRAARCAFRANAADPLDSGTVWGLAFILYGDPAEALLCPQGHRVDAGPTVACRAILHSGRACGTVVCPAEPGFAQRLCNDHAVAEPVKCSAGHRVAGQSQLAPCRIAGCRNTICPACRGWGQGLCWEHCCHEGHPIVGPAARKTCRDPDGRHTGERRSICPLDAGYLRGLCDHCLAEANQSTTSCAHCAAWIDEAHNPRIGVCENCQGAFCACCHSWYEQTLYCRNPNLPKGQRDAMWMSRLEQRAKSDKNLATPDRLRARVAFSNDFLNGLATNVVEQTRRWDLLPKLRLSVFNIFLPQPRALRGVRQNAAELDAELSRRFRDRWMPQLNPPWQPPSDWQKAYELSSRLEVHEILPLAGHPVLVAVATVTLVSFELNRGPVLIPADADHLARVEQTLRQWWTDKAKTELPDVYLVVFSTTGWRDDVSASYRPGLLTVIAGSDGDQVRVEAPPLDGKPKEIHDFVERLSPRTIYQRNCLIRKCIESTLERDEHVTVFRIQDALEPQLGQIRDHEVEEAFWKLERSGRYVSFWLDDDQRALRRATRPERAKRAARRRRWWSLMMHVASVVSVIFGFAAVIAGKSELPLGAFATAAGLQLLREFFWRLALFFKQP